jgi:hypothetical protein
MSDIIDKANETAETFLAASLRWRMIEVPAACGVCLNCNTTIELTRRWCDTDCREDYMRRAPRDRPPIERERGMPPAPMPDEPEDDLDD